MANGTQLGLSNGVGVCWLEVIADPIRLSILRSLSETDDATATDLAVRGQASTHTIRRHLDALLTFGVVQEEPGESDGQSPGRPPARFRLAAEIRESTQVLRSCRSHRLLQTLDPLHEPALRRRANL